MTGVLLFGAVVLFVHRQPNWKPGALPIAVSYALVPYAILAVSIATVDDIDDTLARLRKRGAQLVGEVVQYEDAYRLCYIRGPEGLLIGLAEELKSSVRA